MVSCCKIGKINGVFFFRKTCTQNCSLSETLDLRANLPDRPVPRFHSYRLNHCRRDNTVFLTLREVCSLLFFSTWVSMTFSIHENTHWRIERLVEGLAWNYSPLGKVVRSESRFNSLRLPWWPVSSPREKKLHGNVWSHAAFTCSSYGFKKQPNFTHLIVIYELIQSDLLICINRSTRIVCFQFGLCYQIVYRNNLEWLVQLQLSCRYINLAFCTLL